MNYSTACRSTEELAKKLYTDLHSYGIVFPQLFPYNRFSTDTSGWWACEKGKIPAYSRMKVSFSPSIEHGQLGFFVGVGVEKGYGEQHEKSNQRMTMDWDWYDYVQKVRSETFTCIENSCPGWFGRMSSTLLDSRLSRHTEKTARTHQDLVALIDAIEKHKNKDWFWCDFYIGTRLSFHPESDHEERFLSEFLVPMITWFWPGLPQT